MWNIYDELTSDGMTIIMATLFPDHTFLVADSVVILNKGRISQIGVRDDVVTEENLRSA